MYKYSNGQISLSDFKQPVGMDLKENNRWVKSRRFRGRILKSSMRRCSRTKRATLPSRYGWRWVPVSSRRSTDFQMRRPLL